MNCTLARYLAEQQVVCLRMAKAANDGTKAQEEWLKTAEAIHERQVRHIADCKQCSEAKKT